jgi:radical SAM superfamily enzyme YgiQ (UPF0313 family)
MLSQSKKRYLLRIVVPVYPAFNIYSFIAQHTTALGPVCVASVINDIEKWDVEVIDENNLRRFGPRGSEGGADHEYLQKERPADVVGLYGGLTSTIPRLYKIARFYKQHKVTTVAGGAHFTSETIEEALTSGIDFVVLGEGEETIKDLLHILETKKDVQSVRGIAYRKDGHVIRTECRMPITDFDVLPLPDYSLVRYAKIDLYPIGRIRGCGMNCEFCTVKGRPRCASPERMLEMVRNIVETQAVKSFFIVDDLFGQDRGETLRLCALLKKYREASSKALRLTAQIRLDKAVVEELLIAMRNAGIDQVAIGFESPIPEELEAMKKKLKPEEMITLSHRFHEKGFLVHGMFIFGYPLKKSASFLMPLEQRIECYRRFIKKAKIDTVQVLLPVPLPGTELRERLKQEERVYSVEDVGWEYYDGNFPLYEPGPPLTAEDMQKAIRKLMGGFYAFKYLFLIGFNIMTFFRIVVFMRNIKVGWRRWYRQWRNNLIRFGGWITLKKWTVAFKKDEFLLKLKKAEKRLAKKD